MKRKDSVVTARYSKDKKNKVIRLAAKEDKTISDVITEGLDTYKALREAKK